MKRKEFLLGMLSIPSIVILKPKPITYLEAIEELRKGKTVLSLDKKVRFYFAGGTPYKGYISSGSLACSTYDMELQKEYHNWKDPEEGKIITDNPFSAGFSPTTLIDNEVVTLKRLKQSYFWNKYKDKGFLKFN